ncbi:hypothetical protein Mgra_00004958 [Meloidogyne graminicola]|uniref:Uncharacterized protein n=1 Tax=Meloidogyne graminicola TaxID=189291 RepID=A0A8S9ZQ48_9BILA|nr:hypothetical protein Mgra_00004958 [Meloidogyne graminicola]
MSAEMQIGTPQIENKQLNTKAEEEENIANKHQRCLDTHIIIVPLNIIQQTFRNFANKFKKNYVQRSRFIKT